MQISAFNSQKITVLNLVLILLVLYIHSYYLEAGDYPLALAIQKFTGNNGIARVAVPLFFLISGMLFFNNTIALKEEIDYAINTLGLPVIVVYPDFSTKEDIATSSGIRQQVKNLWDKLPVLRDNMGKVATIHVPMNKTLIISALNDPDLKVQTMVAGKYYYKINQ